MSMCGTSNARSIANKTISKQDLLDLALVCKSFCTASLDRSNVDLHGGKFDDYKLIALLVRRAGK